MQNNGYWADLKAPDFGNLPDNTVAILPLGATEQHGAHLPVSVDTTLVDTVLARSLPLWAADTHALILPTLAVTKSNEHLNHPGTLTLSARSLLAVLEDIGASVARTAVRRLVLFNGHGGNTAILEVACRELRLKHDMITAHCSWFGFSAHEGLISPENAAHDLHAGDIETSAMLAARGDLVDMGRATNQPPKSRSWQAETRWIGLNGQAARPGWQIDDLSQGGVCGDASTATMEKGEALIQSAARNFADFLVEFSSFDPAQ